MSALLVDSPKPQAPSWLVAQQFRVGVTLSLLIFAATRLVVWTGAYSGAALRVAIREKIDPPLSWREPQIDRDLANSQSSLSSEVREQMADFAPLMRWDAGHYEWIVRDGYRYELPQPGAAPEANQWNIAFFPLYPLLCRALAPWIGVHGAMMFVAGMAGFAAVVAMYTVASVRVGHVAALWCVALLSCWPTSAFLSFGYPESLALALSLFAIGLADHRHWIAAAIVCGLCAATRPTLVMLAPLLAWVYATRGGKSDRPNWLAACPYAALCMWGALAYAGYLTWRFGSPWVYFSNFQAGWLAGRGVDWGNYLSFSTVADGFRFFGRALRDFPVGLAYLANPITWNIPLVLSLLVVSLLGWRGVARDFRPYLLLAPLIFLQRYAVSGWNSFATESLARYVGLAAPTLLVLGAWVARDWSTGARATLIAGLLLLQAIWAVNFGLSQWAG